MKTNKERTESILRKTRQKERQKKIITRTAVASLAVAAVTALNLVLFLPYETEVPSTVAKYQNSEYFNVICALDKMSTNEAKTTYKNNYEKWTAGLKNLFAEPSGGNGTLNFNEFIDGNVYFEVEANDALADSPGAWDEDVGEGYVETTDNQVTGVIEGDLFKRTNTHIFYMEVNPEYCIRTYSIEGANSKQVGATKVDLKGFFLTYNHAPQIYLSSDGTRLTLLASVYTKTISSETNRTKTDRYTLVIGYDASDPTEVKEVNRVYLTGDYISSRMTDGSLLLLNNFTLSYSCNLEDLTTYVPHYGSSLEDMKPVAGEDIVCPENGTARRYTVVCEIDPTSFAVEDSAALFSYTSQAYVSAENIFVTRQYNERIDVSEEEYKTVAKTEISTLYYGGEGLEYKGSAIVDGTVKNQYSMDEYNGILRVATTNSEVTSTKQYSEKLDYEWWRISFPQTAGSLYCIDIETMEQVASVEKFITGETVESVRFDKDKAYVCTAVVLTLTDPVFAFDLSDLSNITYVDTGVIEGYSTSLVNFTDGYLLGIGYNEMGGLKIEIYCETENAVESVCLFEKNGWFSEDYKSYYIDRENGLVGLAVDNVYYLLQFDGYGLNVVLEKEMVKGYHSPSTVRATLIGEYFYVIGSGEGNFFVENIVE